MLPVQSASPSPQNFMPQNHGAVFRADCDQIVRRTIQISCKSIQRVRPVGPPVNTRCGARWGAQTGAAAIVPSGICPGILCQGAISGMRRRSSRSSETSRTPNLSDGQSRTPSAPCRRLGAPNGRWWRSVCNFSSRLPSLVDQASCRTFFRIVEGSNRCGFECQPSPPFDYFRNRTKPTRA